MLKKLVGKVVSVVLIAAFTQSFMDYSGLIKRDAVLAASANTFFEAENCTLTGSAAPYNDTYASDGRGVAYLDSAGDGIQFGNAAYANRIKIRYASGNNGTISLYINGGYAGKINIASTGGWTGGGKYAAVNIDTDVPTGATVKIQFDSGDVAINVDWISLINTQPSRLEAELGRLQGSAAIYSDASASGGKGVAYIDSINDGIQFEGVCAATQLTVRYASSNTGTLSLYINGSHTADISIISTGGWSGSNYGFKTVNVNIPKNADIKLQYDNGDVAVNIDCILLTYVTEAECSKLLGGASVYSDPGLSNGQGVAYIDSNGDGIQFDGVAASTQMTIRYTTANNGTLSLYINGTHTMNISFPSTGGWSNSNFALKTVTVNIPSNASVKFQFDSGDAAVNIDYVRFDSPSAATNKTFYVSNSSGSDANDGLSSSTPWKTLAKVSASVFNPGDAIYLKCGDTWNENLVLSGAGNAAAPITLTSYSTGNKPKIRYGGSDVISLENTGGWVIKGLEVECTSTGTYSKGGQGNGGIRLNYTASGHWSDIVIDNNLVHGQGIDTNTSGITVSSVFQTGKDDEVLNNITLSNNTVYNVGVIGIATNAWDLKLDNNLTSKKLFRNVVMKGNTVYNTACQGIYIMAANNGRVERNLVHDCGLYSGVGGTGWGPVGIMTIAVSDIEVMFNQIYGMKDANNGYDGTGIDIDWSSNAVKVQYNYCYGNQGNGIDTMSCTSSKILNNKVKGNGITLQGSGQLAMTDLQVDPIAGSFKGVKDLEVANNLVYVDTAGTSGISSKTYYGSSATWSGNSFHNNNIIIQNTSGTRDYDLASSTLLGSADNNRFYSGNASFAGNAYGTSYNTLPAWRNGTGLDASSNTYVSETVAPTDATNLTATSERANNRIRLAWTAGTDSGSGIWHYNIYRSTDPGFTPGYLNMVGESAAASFYDTGDLTASTTYYYKVETEDMCGNIGTALASVSVAY